MTTEFGKTEIPIPDKLLVSHLLSGGLHLSYQPIFHSKTLIPWAIEALCRTSYHNINDISPAQRFSLLASADESVSLAKSIASIGLSHASKITRHFGEINLSLNVHLSDITPSFIHHLTTQANHVGFPLSSVILEILETSNIVVTSALLNRINSLRQQGVLMALDDWGVRYSNEIRLSQIPIDIIKIDKDVLRNISHSQKDFIKLRSAVLIWKSEGKVIVCEGIEDEAMLEIATQIGADYLQGYLLARPHSNTELHTSFIIKPDKNIEKQRDLA